MVVCFHRGQFSHFSSQDGRLPYACRALEVHAADQISHRLPLTCYFWVWRMWQRPAACCGGLMETGGSSCHVRETPAGLRDWPRTGTLSERERGGQIMPCREHLHVTFQRPPRLSAHLSCGFDGECRRMGKGQSGGPAAGGSAHTHEVRQVAELRHRGS